MGMKNIIHHIQTVTGRIPENRRSIIWLVFLYLACILLASRLSFNELGSGDKRMSYIQYKAIAMYGELNLDRFKREIPSNHRKCDNNGHIYTKYGIGYPLLAAIMTRPLRLLRLTDAKSWLSSFDYPGLLLFFISGIWLYQLFRKLKAGRIISFLAAAGYLAGSQSLCFARSWNSNSIVCSLFIGALYSFRAGTSTARPRTGYLVLTGIILGYAGLVRNFAFIAFPGFALALFLHDADSFPRKRIFNLKRIKTVLYPLAALAVPYIIGIAVYLLVNYAKTGKLADTYANELRFNVPFYVGFLGNIFWPGKSFPFYYPMVLAGLFGWSAMWKQDKSLFAVSLWIVSVYVILYSKWWAWWSGPGIGQRFWMPAFPFMLLPIAFLKKKWLPAVMTALLVFGSINQYYLRNRSLRAVFAVMYRQFPYSENAGHVKKILDKSGGLWRVFKRTWVEGSFCQACKKTRTIKNRGIKKVRRRK